MIGATSESIFMYSILKSLEYAQLLHDIKSFSYFMRLSLPLFCHFLNLYLLMRVVFLFLLFSLSAFNHIKWFGEHSLFIIFIQNVLTLDQLQL